MIVHRAPPASGRPPLRLDGPWPRRLAAAVLVAAAILAAGTRLRRAGGDAPVERISLGLRAADLSRLEARRRRALEEGVLVASDADDVPAEIGYGGRRMKAKVRLKGHFLDHLEDEDWSFGVNLSAGESVLGMTRFSLMHPRRRHYADEWLLLRVLRREGLLALRYEFVRLDLNGRDLGLYALEEHFNSKGLLAASRRSDGPVVRFDDENFWRDMRRTGADEDSAGAAGMQELAAAAPTVFRAAHFASDPALAAQAAAATALLEGARSGTVPASNVFDAARMGRFFALSELLMGLHGAATPLNLRFYYDPLAARLEPIGYDANESEPGESFSRDWAGFPAEALRDETGFYARLFADRAFLAAYIRALDEVTAPGWLEGALAGAGAPPSFEGYSFPRAALERNRARMRARVDPERALSAFVVRDEAGGLELEAGNLLALPVEVLGVSVDGRFAALPAPLFLPARAPRALVAYAPLRVATPAPGKGVVEVRYRVFGTEGLRSAPASRTPRAVFDAGAHALRRPSTVGRFPFLRTDEKSRRVTARPGSWTMDEDLIVPEGWTLRFGPGVRLALRGTAKIVSRSPLDFDGAEDDPVVLESAGGAGQGLAVFAGGRRSRLRRTLFKGLAPPSSAGWALSGAVTFYDSPVEISQSRFEGSRAEDALHIVRSEFALTGVSFRGSRSDALDVDFGRGEVTGCSFTGSGNDGMDFSGTVAAVRRSAVTRAGDKGVSAGEDSDIRLEGLTVEDARIGVASKDASVVEASELRLSRCGVGLAAYRKKAEFGPARLTVKGLDEERVGARAVVGGGSSCVIDESAVAPDPAAAARLLDEPGGAP